MAAYSGFPEESYDSVFITLDKMDKIGLDGVKQELLTNGFAEDGVNKYLDLFEGLEKAEDGVEYLVSALGDYLDAEVAQNLQEIMASVKQTEQGAYLTLDPAKTKAIMDSVGVEVKKLEDLGKMPIVITSPIVRVYFKKLTEDYYKDLVVVSYNEIESNIELQSVGMVTA